MLERHQGFELGLLDGAHWRRPAARESFWPIHTRGKWARAQRGGFACILGASATTFMSMIVWPITIGLRELALMPGQPLIVFERDLHNSKDLRALIPALQNYSNHVRRRGR